MILGVSADTEPFNRDFGPIAPTNISFLNLNIHGRSNARMSQELLAAVVVLLSGRLMNAIYLPSTHASACSELKLKPSYGCMSYTRTSASLPSWCGTAR
jgi:hypothetical protein